MRFVRRAAPSALRSAAVGLAALALAIVLGAGLFAALGVDPLAAYATMLQGACGTGYGAAESVVRMVPLGLCALAVALAARMGLWNVGAEGQLLMGAVAASWVALAWPLPGPCVLPAMAVAGALAGAAWCTVAAALRARLGVSEVLSTLMLNYLAEGFLHYLVYGPWKGPDRFPYTVPFPESAWLPAWGATRIHPGVLLLPLVAGLLHLVLARTRLGFEIALAGDAPEASEYAGVPARRNLVLVMALSGALAGLAGMLEVAGLQHRLQPGISPGYGYTAIIVAWLARRHMLAIVPVALVFGGLAVAGDELQIALRVPQGAVGVFQGLLFASFLGLAFLERHELAGEAPDGS